MRSQSQMNRAAALPPAMSRATAEARSQSRGRLFRRILIFIAMIVEAGLPFFPRVPLTGLLFILSSLAVVLSGGLDRRTIPLFAIPLLVMAEMIFLHEATTPEQIVSRFVNFCSAIFLVNLYIRAGQNSLAYDLRPIFRLMAVQGIITIILANAVPNIFSTVIWGDYDYKTLSYIFTYHMTEVDTFAKADGFFFERGVFQIFLNLFLFFSLFVYKSRSDALLAAAGVLSTWSTTGAVIMVILFACSVLFGPDRSTNNLRFGSLVIIGLLLVPLGAVAYFNVQDKLYGDQSSSADARQFDAIAGVQIIAEYPLVGLGFSPDVFANVFRTKATLFEGGELLVERGMSNGIIRIFLAVGIPIGLIFVFGLFNSTLVPNPVIAGQMLFLSLLTEPIVFCPFMLMLIFSGLTLDERGGAAALSRIGLIKRRAAVRHRH